MYLSQAIHDLVIEATPTAPADDFKTVRENITWALGLPGLLLGAIASIWAIPKFKSGRRKDELEILKLERELADMPSPGNPSDVARIVAGPIIANRRGQDLILRFIFLYLVLQAWGIVDRLLHAAIGGAQAGWFGVVGAGQSLGFILGAFLLALVSAIPTVVGGLLFVVIGWPVLLETTRLVGISLPEFLYSDGARRLLIGLVVIGAIASPLLGAGLTLFDFL